MVWSFVISTNLPSVAVFTNAVVANWLVLSSNSGVGAVGTPINSGDNNGDLWFKLSVKKPSTAVALSYSANRFPEISVSTIVALMTSASRAVTIALSAKALALVSENTLAARPASSAIALVASVSSPVLNEWSPISLTTASVKRSAAMPSSALLARETSAFNETDKIATEFDLVTD